MHNEELILKQNYIPLLEIWAQYLNSSLPDPGNQLCTDDMLGMNAHNSLFIFHQYYHLFRSGPMPHNANLAVKGIEGLGAYSMLSKSLGLW